MLTITNQLACSGLRCPSRICVLVGFGCLATATFAAELDAKRLRSRVTPNDPTMHSLSTALGHKEELRDPWLPGSDVPPPGVRTGRAVVERDGFVSVQVNTDEFGNNIPGDAANEPSIAVDPTSPNRMVIGWRQFDNAASDFRQAGWGYTTDGGSDWTFPGVIEPGVFRSDPVLDFDADGYFYYYSLRYQGNEYCCDLSKSADGGMTWSDSRVFAYGGDKGWMTIDRTAGPGRGHVYTIWTRGSGCFYGDFARYVGVGDNFGAPLIVPSNSHWGTLSVAANGDLYIVGAQFSVIRSENAQLSNVSPSFSVVGTVDLGGVLRFDTGPNPGGLLGQVWVATDHSAGPTAGYVYVLASVFGAASDPLDVMFARSVDGGQTWSEPVRVNDDPIGGSAWQWFGTMSVAPNGRIDVIWNDTRNSGVDNLSELYYASSRDGGVTWSPNVPVSPMFDSHIGWPNQDKIGDYYDMVSDNAGANVAYAATFNGEQDVYYLWIDGHDCNENGVPDAKDIADGTSTDCNENVVPDECEPDCNQTGVADTCDIANGTSEDCDENFVPDECDPDFDGDGLIDACDDDIDDDGVPNDVDICDHTPIGTAVQPDGSPRADTNGNCAIDLTDYRRFRACLSAGGPDTAGDPATCLAPFDHDGDSYIDLRDASVFQRQFNGEGF